MRGMVAGISAVLVLGLAGCGDSTDRLRQQASSSQASASQVTTTSAAAPQAMSDWGSQRFSPVVGRISEGFTWAGGALQSLDLADARAAGRSLNASVDELAATLPSPDPAVDADVELAVDSFRKYARGLMGISPSVTSAELKELTGYQDAGVAAVGRVTEQIKASRR